MKKAFTCLLLFCAFLPLSSHTFPLSRIFFAGDNFRTPDIDSGPGTATLFPGSYSQNTGLIRQSHAKQTGRIEFKITAS
jgi:hypothetical protein